MVLWHWALGIGLALVAAIITSNAAIGYSPTRNHRRKNTTFSQTPNDKCSVCMETMQNGDMQYLLCCHALHEKCLKELKKYSSLCPICREQI